MISLLRLRYISFLKSSFRSILITCPLIIWSSLVHHSVLLLYGPLDQLKKKWNEQKTASGFGKKLSSELTDALPYSISEKSKTDCTSRHLGDITFAFQYFCVPTRLENLIVLCFDLILISMN